MVPSSFFFQYYKRLLFQTQNLSLPNHPWPFSSKPKTQKKKKKISHISLSFTFGVCVCFLSSFLIYDSFFLSRCVCIRFLSSFLIYDSFFLSLSLSGQNNERGCDDGFVDVKSVKVSSITEKGPRLSKSGSYIGSWEVSGIGS